MRARQSGLGGTLRACGAFLLVLAMASSAAAQDDVERTALARSLFRQGVELSDAGRWDEAADRFRRSISLRDSPVVAFNLGTALTHTGHLLEASELFRRAARDADAPAALAQAAGAQLEAIQPRLGRLTVEVAGASDAAIELDGEPMPAEVVGVPAPADPGHHVLRAMRGEDEVARAEVDVPEGGAAVAELEVPPPPVASADEAARTIVHEEDPPVPRETTPPAGGDDTAIWIGVITAVVVVGAAAAITTYFLLDGQSSAMAIPGNLSPAVITFE